MPIERFVLFLDRGREVWAPENVEDRSNMDNGDLVTCPYTTLATTSEDTADRANVRIRIRDFGPYQSSPDSYCGQICNLDCPAKNEF